MKEFNQLMEYREYYIYDTENEVFCIATGPKHNEALELYTQIADTYFKDEHARWEFEVALDCVHNFSDEDIKTIQDQEKIFRYHFFYGMYVRNHYIYGSKKHRYFMADSISSTIEKLIYTIVLPVYNYFSKQFMKLVQDFAFQDIQVQYGKTQPIIGKMLKKLAAPDNAMTAEEALKIISTEIQSNLNPRAFQEIVIPILLEHIETYGHINAAPVELSNALYSETRVFYRRYNQLKAIIQMRVALETMEPFPKWKTLEETQACIVDELGISEDDALCMAECAMAIGKKQREVLDRDKEKANNGG